METDIGNPIEYNPTMDSLNDKNEEPEQPYYMDYPIQPPPPPPQNEKFDLFDRVEKSTWIIAFAVFLLGFFMGKTMQPVILRYAWVRNECPDVPVYRFNFTRSIFFNERRWIQRNNKRIICIFDKTSSSTDFGSSIYFVL